MNNYESILSMSRAVKVNIEGKRAMDKEIEVQLNMIEKDIKRMSNVSEKNKQKIKDMLDVL